MSKRSKAQADASKFDKDIENMIESYIAATGDKDWTRQKVAEWVIGKGLWEQQRISAMRELSRIISRVAGKATFEDKETGRRIRKYHAWRLGHDQPTFWSAMEGITRENMAYSSNWRRDKLVKGAVKGINDVEYFNTHHNPGDPILFETDLTKDVNEKRLPTLYDDAPPPDDAPGGKPA